MQFSKYESYEESLSVIIGFCHGSHCSIGLGPELGQVQWRGRRDSHWFNKYHRARRRSGWPDLEDRGPCGRRETGREDSDSTAEASFWPQAITSEAMPTKASLQRCSAQTTGISRTAQILQASHLKWMAIFALTTCFRLCPRIPVPARCFSSGQPETSRGSLPGFPDDNPVEGDGLLLLGVEGRGLLKVAHYRVVDEP